MPETLGHKVEAKQLPIMQHHTKKNTDNDVDSRFVDGLGLKALNLPVTPGKSRFMGYIRQAELQLSCR